MSENEKTSQRNIKNENTRAIFSAIAESDGISRAALSEKTGLSLMTVGKAADALTAEGLITQSKPATGAAGRRAGMLTLSESYFMLSLDISGETFAAKALSLALKETESLYYPYNRSLTSEDNLMIFFRESGSLLLKQLKSKKLIGVGILISGDKEQQAFMNPHVTKDTVKNILKSAVGISPDLIMNGMEAAMLSQLDSLGNEKKQCVISLRIDENINGCIAIDGRLLEKASNFGALLCGNGKTLAHNAAGGTMNEEAFASELAFALAPIVKVICPDVIFITAGGGNLSEWFSKLLTKAIAEFISENIPEIIFKAGKRSDGFTGIGMKLREKLIDSI